MLGDLIIYHSNILFSQLRLVKDKNLKFQMNNLHVEEIDAV